MAAQRKACLIYVESMEAARHDVLKQLAAEGFFVCESILMLGHIDAANSAAELPGDVRDCIDGADLCVIILPESERDDPVICAAAAVAISNGCQVIVVNSGRPLIPTILEDGAHSVVSGGSTRLADAIKGIEIWEDTDGTPRAPRAIKRVRCQS